MIWRFFTVAVLLALLLVAADCPAAEDKPADQGSIKYLPLDAPAGMSQAVIVEGKPLVHTRQLVPLAADGKMVDGGAEKQVEQVLNNLEAVLDASGSGLDQLVRLNIYALETSTVDSVCKQLAARLDDSIRPAITSVLTPMPHREALVAVDAVAVTVHKSETVSLKRCEAVSGDTDCADAAVLPPGGVAYLSGIPAEGSVAQTPVDESMAGLMKMLGNFKLTPADVVRLKVFLRPASSADDVRQTVKKYFPDQLTPPVVFVEWLAPPPVEIEMIARLPVSDQSAPNVEHYDPPEAQPMQVFCRAGLVRTPKQIYTSGLFSQEPGRGQDQAQNVFDQLEALLEATGSDLLHMAKATYYASDDDSARGLDRVRLWRYDQDHPPAASKCMVHGMGRAERSLTLDMIAVEADSE